MVLEVAGAIRYISDHKANSTWSFQIGLSKSVAINEDNTGFLESVD